MPVEADFASLHLLCSHLQLLHVDLVLLVKDDILNVVHLTDAIGVLGILEHLQLLVLL